MFRWHLKHDIDLAREVVAVRPGPGLTDWNLIAANLQAAWPEDPQRHLKGRSCKEHFEVMLTHHKEGNEAALKKSGTEEEYNAIHQLMDDAASYFADMQRDKGVKKIKKRATEDEDKQKGFEMRDAAMKTLKQKSPGSGSDEDEDDSPGPSRKKAKTRTHSGKRPDVVSFLENKNKAFTEFRERELEYKREQLAADIKLKQEQMELDKRRVGIQEQQMELQLQMMQALIQSKT